MAFWSKKFKGKNTNTDLEVKIQIQTLVQQKSSVK